MGSIAPSVTPTGGGPGPPDAYRMRYPPADLDTITPVASVEHQLQGLALHSGGHPAALNGAGPSPAYMHPHVDNPTLLYETASSTAAFEHADDLGAGGDKGAATRAILQYLSSPDLDPNTFREAASYHMWQLKELALDDKCREVMLSHSIAGLLVQVFRASAEHDAAAAAALCVKRLAVEGPSVCQMFVAARVIEYLVVALRSRYVCLFFV